MLDVNLLHKVGETQFKMTQIITTRDLSSNMGIDKIMTTGISSRINKSTQQSQHSFSEAVTLLMRSLTVRSDF